MPAILDILKLVVCNENLCIMIPISLTYFFLKGPINNKP